jgi:hypothetical protein
MSGRNIPTEEDFAWADAAMRHRDRGLSEVRSIILNRFVANGLHQVFILYSPDNDLFGAYLFFNNEDEQIASEQSGLTEQIQASVLDELERVGRGEKSALNVDFEIDNDDNVQREYDGDYYSRLR